MTFGAYIVKLSHTFHRHDLEVVVDIVWYAEREEF